MESWRENILGHCCVELGKNRVMNQRHMLGLKMLGLECILVERSAPFFDLTNEMHSGVSGSDDASEGDAHLGIQSESIRIHDEVRNFGVFVIVGRIAALKFLREQCT